MEEDKKLSESEWLENKLYELERRQLGILTVLKVFVNSFNTVIKELEGTKEKQEDETNGLVN